MLTFSFQELTIVFMMMSFVGIIIGMIIGHHLWYKPEDHRDIPMRREWLS